MGSTPPTFGEWLKLFRRARDFTQEDLAALLDCSVGVIQKTEQGKYRLSKQIIGRLVEVIGLRPSERESFTRYARSASGSDPGTPSTDVNLWLRTGTETSPTEVQLIRHTSPGSAPPQPRLVLGRDEDLRLLKARLATDRVDATPTPLYALTAVHGWPGVGKTTLATALAYDRDVAQAFPDGVLWASIGQHPNIFSQLAAWGRALGAPLIAQTGSIEEASAQLAALLRDQRRLLIVDDIWEARHALPFRVGGGGCALLITTRLPEVARALAPSASDIYLLDVLSDESALALLITLAPVVAREDTAASLTLVQELEGLPLAIQVAGRLLHAESSYGFSVDDLLAEIREGSLLLEEEAPLDNTGASSQRSPTVAALLRKSTDRLEDGIRECFAYLGAFAPKPATFDVPAMQAVLQVGDARPIVRTLVDRGLLEPVGGGRFWMHALLVDHARSLLTKGH